MLKGVEAINSPYPLFISRDEENINAIEFANGKNNLRLTRQEAKKILTPETINFIKFAEGAVQFWKSEDEEEVMIYFYGTNETSIIITLYDEFKTALLEILR